MKKIIIAIVILLITQTRLISQTCTPNPAAQNCETGKGISTNPNNHVNPECPNLVNNFDWRVKHTPGGNVPDERFWVYYNDDQNPTWIRNPFNGPINASYGNLTDNHNSNYHPEDGWELLKVEFGSNGNIGLGVDVQPGPNTVSNERPKLPYMILYNKYSGTMRFFGSLLEPDNTYETVRIELRIPTQSPLKQGQTYINVYNPDLKATNLLSIQGETVQPLDQETDESSIAVFVKYTNNPKVFFWFDLPVTYDPCVCNNKVQLDVSFAFVQTANIDITGKLSGGIKTEKKGTQDYGKMAFGRILAAGVSGAVAIKTGGAVVNYKAFIDLIDVVRDHPNRNQTERDNLDKLKNYLTCAEKMFSVVNGSFKDVTTSSTLKADLTKQIAAGQKILDANTTFLSSLVNGCKSSDNAATTITGAITASGTFTLKDEIAATHISLALPGSNWSDKQMQSNTNKQGTWIPSYPTYNERLGVLSILETPELGVHIKRTECSTYVNGEITMFANLSYSFLLSEKLKYVFNPKVNININKSKIQVRLVVKMPINNGPPINSSLKVNLINIGPPINLHYRSSCLVDSSIITPINFYSESNSMYNFNTPYVDIDDFANLPLRFDITKLGLPFLQFNEDSLMKYAFFQIKVIGVSNDIGTDNKNNTFYLNHTYPVKIKTLNSDPYSSIDNKLLPNFKKGIKEFDTDVQFNINEQLFFEGPVFITAQMSTTNGKKVKIYSMNGFELMPGAKISPDIELIVGFPWDKIPQPPQTYAQVSSFCGNNNKYKAQRFSQSAVKREKEEYEARQIREEEAIKQKSKVAFKLSPNPTTANFTISIFNNNEQDYSIALMDVTGKVLFNNSYNGKQTSQHIETNGLAAGIYFVRITCGNTQKTEKLIIQSNY